MSMTKNVRRVVIKPEICKQNIFTPRRFFLEVYGLDEIFCKGVETIDELCEILKKLEWRSKKTEDLTLRVQEIEMDLGFHGLR